jgi:hypothetical protein
MTTYYIYIASLPTLSASLGRASMELSPKKKGRGRPRKSDKDKSLSSPDLFRYREKRYNFF